MQIAIGLYPEFTALDAIGPYQVFTQIPGVDVVVCAERTGRLSDDNGLLHFDVEHTFADSVERRCAALHVQRMLERGEATEIAPGTYQSR